MKKYVLMTAMVTIFTLPTMAWSQQAAPAGGASGKSAAPAAADTKNGGEEKFEDRKARVLKHLDEHLAEVQTRITCVKASTKREQLHACMPEHHETPDAEQKAAPSEGQGKK